MDGFDDRPASEVRAEAVYPVFGHRVDVRFLGHDARALAEESFCAWNALRPEDVSTREPAECSVIVMPAGGAIPGAPEYAVSEEDLVVPNGEVTMFVDRGDGRGCILTPRAAVEETPRAFQKLYLEAAVQFLASAEDRVPLHASAAVVGETTLLLAGPSGAGKSTLLYALMQAGAQVLAEESVCIAYRERLALWGAAREIGLRAEALPLFPDLAGEQCTLQPNGKEKCVLPVPAAQRAYPKQTGRVVLIFLGEGDGLAELDAANAKERLLSNREAGFDLAPDYVEAVDALLAQAHCWTLGRGESPSAMAAPLLKLA